jgi:zinc protease
MIKSKIDVNTDNLFMVYVFIRAGSINETNDVNRGVSHSLEHMLFKQSEKYSKNDLLAKLTRIGGVYNAITDKDVTYYYIKTSSSNWKDAMVTIFSMIFEPKLLAKEWSMEKKVVIEELLKNIEQNDDKTYLSLFPKTHAYVKTVSATPEAIDKLDRNHLRKYYVERYMNLDNISFAISCTQSVKPHVARYIKTQIPTEFLKNAHAKQVPPLIFPPQPKIVFQRSKARKEVVMSFNSYPVAEWRQNIKLTLLNYILVKAGLYGILTYELREVNGLVYHVSCDIEMGEFCSIVQISFSTGDSDLENILSKIFGIINKIKKNGIDTAAFLLYKESYSTLLTYLMSNHEKKFMHDAIRFHYGVEHHTLAQIIDEIQNCTINDIIDCARDVYNFQKMGIYVAGKFALCNIPNLIQASDILYIKK